MIDQIRRILDRDRRVALSWAVGLSVFSYFLFFSQHILGNHALRLPWLHKSEQVGNGRWLGPLVGHLHYDADVPVFMPAFGIALGALAILIAAECWQLTRSKLENITVFAITLIFPMNLAFFYYSFMTPLFFIANLFAVLAIFFLSKGSIWRLLVGSLFVLLMLASYQAAVSIFGVLTFAWAVSHLMRTRDKPLGDELRHQASIVVMRVAGAGLGGLAYVYSLKKFKVPDAQSLEFHSIADVIARVRLVVFSAFNHLVTTQPDMLPPLKLTLLAVLVAAIIGSLIYLRRTPVRAAIVLLLWLLMIASTKAIFLISDPTGSIYEYRYNAGLGFLHAFSFAVLFFCAGQWRVVKGLCLTVSSFVLLTMIQANLVRQDVLMRGQAHDLAFANRILARIEQLDDFDPAKTYDLIRIGRYSTFRYDLYRAGHWKIDRAGDGHMDYGELTDRWVDEDVFRLLGARIHFQQTSTDPRFAQKYAAVAESGVLDGHEPWPAASSVFVSDNRIIVLMERPKSAIRELPNKVVINEGDTLAAKFDADQWRSVTGAAANLQIQQGSIAFSAGQSGLSVDALVAHKGNRFRLVFGGEILDKGSNGIPLSFAAGPVFLDSKGEVVGWWSSVVGREAVELAAEDGSFSYSREVIAPASSASAHIAFHGPYSPDGEQSDGRIAIASAHLERLDGPVK